jgi:hypothetical protein
LVGAQTSFRLPPETFLWRIFTMPDKPQEGHHQTTQRPAGIEAASHDAWSIAKHIGGDAAKGCVAGASVIGAAAFVGGALVLPPLSVISTPVGMAAGCAIGGVALALEAGASEVWNAVRGKN